MSKLLSKKELAETLEEVEWWFHDRPPEWDDVKGHIDAQAEQIAQRDATIRSLREDEKLNTDALTQANERIRKLREAGNRVNKALHERLPFESTNNIWAQALAADRLLAVPDAKEGEGK